MSHRRLHTPIRSESLSRGRPSIGSPLTFGGHISVRLRCHSISSLIPHRHWQTHSQRSCLGHKSFFMHGNGRVHSVPRFQHGIDPFIGHPSCNRKMPVYREPCICSPIHPDNTTSMTLGPSAKPPQPSFFGIARRRTSSRYQSEAPCCYSG